ncbi:RNA methyltransferase bin3, C-terminal [Dillenia turbinata]|uniref:RNA methyltransferase n=1 Tax=Dillenia turbinata TaxID=194707 RepID=A0AAN8VWF0_9MAGN
MASEPKRKRKNQDTTEKEEPQEHEAKNSQSKKQKRKKPIFPFGNYRNYYGYRIGPGSEDDPRLKVMRKEWFEGKDCLDIGCNNGLLTITFAIKFNCKSIVGIDIDGDRIEDAHWHLRKFARQQRGNVPSKGHKSEVSVITDVVRCSQLASLDEEKSEILNDQSASTKRDLFDVVAFRKENFVQSWQLPPGRYYDTIMCLSVTKWIHLNWGDEGLITLFVKIWRLLRPGGILILEPQPWDSYVKNYQVSETATANYKSIKIYPQEFQDILLDKVGFRTVENITSNFKESKDGFNRPILVFCK